MLSLPSECILNILARLPLADVVATASCCTGEWLVLDSIDAARKVTPADAHPALVHPIHSPAPGGRRRLLLGSPGRGQMGRRCAAAKDSLRNRCALAELLLQPHVGTHDQVRALTRVQSVYLAVGSSSPTNFVSVCCAAAGARSTCCRRAIPTRGSTSLAACCAAGRVAVS